MFTDNDSATLNRPARAAITSFIRLAAAAQADSSGNTRSLSSSPPPPRWLPGRPRRTAGLLPASRPPGYGRRRRTGRPSADHLGQPVHRPYTARSKGSARTVTTATQTTRPRRSATIRSLHPQAQNRADDSLIIMVSFLSPRAIRASVTIPHNTRRFFTYATTNRHQRPGQVQIQ